MIGLPFELSVSLVASMAAIAVLHLLLWRGVRATYLLWWGAAWLCFALRYSPRLVAADLSATSYSVLFAILRDACLAYGASLYANRAALRWWLLVAAAEVLAFALGAATAPALRGIWAFSRPAVAAIVTATVAYALVVNDHPAPRARRLAAAGYMVFAFDAALASLGIRYEWRFVLDQVGYLGIGIGIALSSLGEASLANVASATRLADTMRFVLRGRVQVCARCRHVEDEKGAWHRPEVFVAGHTRSHISHGICPACMQIHYAELMDGADLA